jgi:16S rRNA (cytidine1402-2'-O)-methyltransferase
LAGTLYIVSTPIGNLKDITLRALDVLKEADFIACEDTRVSSFLINHYDIRKELVSLNAANEGGKVEFVLTKINEGQSCALISDAGTPCISDPGTRLISAAIKQDIQVVPIPGASAVLSALTISGFPADSFVFDGFIPLKKGRQKKLTQLAQEERTIVIYESTYRIEKLLNELNEYMPERLLAVCREITKKFEEVWRGTPAQILENFKDKTTKGEFVVVISPKDWK